MKKVKFVAPLHMIYAYIPIDKGTRVQPIYIAEKRKGILGAFKTKLLLLLTKAAYYFLRDEDGMIYDNINYNPNALLSIDEPLIKYMQYVNQLQPSMWSKRPDETRFPHH